MQSVSFPCQRDVPQTRGRHGDRGDLGGESGGIALTRALNHAVIERCAAGGKIVDFKKKRIIVLCPPPP